MAQARRYICYLPGAAGTDIVRFPKVARKEHGVKDLADDSVNANC